jgi:hypothetical protein
LSIEPDLTVTVLPAIVPLAEICLLSLEDAAAIPFSTAKIAESVSLTKLSVLSTSRNA